MLQAQDHYLPPDHDAFVNSQPPTGRVIVIAPTRAACETIEIALGLHIETYLERTQGERVRELARSGQGFGIVAGTGSGKTLAIRPIAEEIVQAPLCVGVVNREREAGPELANWNVIIVTTGIARRWFQDGDILERDTLIVDEIHQTSAELELCLALGKRAGCRFIWLSATVDPRFYKRYLNSSDVLEVFSFDQSKVAKVEVINREPDDFLDSAFLRQITREKRGVGVFLPTRAGVEGAIRRVHERFPDFNASFYHGGEPIRAIRPFLEEGADSVEKPYLLAMTAAGQSALNVRGLDTVVIDDTRFTNVVDRGRNVLTRLNLGNNEILQMAGRVHGRVAGGRVFIFSNRRLEFDKLYPTAPEFQLAGDSERVALTCADLGVRADELDLPIKLDKIAYRRALEQLQTRGIIGDNGRLSSYGKTVEALPVERAWAELIVNADKPLVPYLAVISSIESLHRMTRENRDIDGLIVPGSDHLTAYNVYADAFQNAGAIGQVYQMPRHLFAGEKMESWATKRGVLIKAIEDAALSMACILRSVKVDLPTQMPLADETIAREFRELLARWMPLDLVIDETTSDGQSARVSRSSMCGGWGPIAGELRYFSDRQGVPRAAIEGTQIPIELLTRYAKRTAPSVVYVPQRPRAPLVLEEALEYHGFELGEKSRPLYEFAGEWAAAARHALAVGLANGQARHDAVNRNRQPIETVRELHRRSGGQTPRLGLDELTAWYENQLAQQNVDSLEAFGRAKIVLNVDDFVPTATGKYLQELPSEIVIEGRQVPVHYELENSLTKTIGVARLRLPEKLVRTLKADDLPQLDRPLRFLVTRGSRGAVRATTLQELQAALEGPWQPNYWAEANQNEPREATKASARRGEARRPGPRSTRGRPKNNDGKRGGKKGRR